MSPSLRGRLLRAVAIAGVGASVVVAACRTAAAPAPPYKDLLAQAEAGAPRLAEAAAMARQAEGLAQQAGARPNPTLGLDVENVGGVGPYRGTSVAETTLRVSQALEFGGKRPARIAAGRAQVDAVRLRLSQARADYAYDLALAYSDAEAAGRRVDLVNETLALAKDDLRAARALVEAGREAELRALQAQSAVTAAEAELASAQAGKSEALAKLSALAGSSTPFTAVSQSLLTQPATPVGETDIEPTRAPAVITAQAEREAAARRVTVERTRAAPDVTASVGLRHFSEDNAVALVGGVSVPLPIFDRNRGSISAAQADLAAADARLNAAILDAEADLRTTRFQIRAAVSLETAARDGVSTAAEAYRLTRIAYEAGKVSLLELNAARRALTDSGRVTIDAQRSRIRAEAGLARLQGRTPFGATP